MANPRSRTSSASTVTTGVRRVHDPSGTVDTGRTETTERCSRRVLADDERVSFATELAGDRRCLCEHLERARLELAAAVQDVYEDVAHAITPRSSSHVRIRATVASLSESSIISGGGRRTAPPPACSRSAGADALGRDPEIRRGERHERAPARGHDRL